MKTALAAFFLVMFLSSSAFAQNADVIINEIMYSPSTEFGGTYNEWVELYNTQPVEINITGWVLSETTKNHTLSGSIDPHEFLILSRKPENFTQYYITSSQVLETKFALDNDGELLLLQDINEMLVDSVLYDTSLGASGKSLERNTTGWFASLVDGGTPGSENSIGMAPEQNESEPDEPDVQENETVVENITENETLPEETAEETETPLGSAEITILSAPASMHFGDYAPLHVSFFSGDSEFSEARIVAYVFSPHWISRELSRDEETIRSAPYSTGVAAAMRNIGTNSTTTIILPIFLKCNEDEKYTEGEYVLRVRLYKNEGSWASVTETDTTISVNGKNPLCEKEIVYVNVTTECEAKETAFEIKDDEIEFSFDVPEIVYPDTNFTANITLKNQGSSTLIVEVYSYLYGRAKLLSYGFDGEAWGKTWGANAVQIELAQNEAKNISLLNLVKNTTSLEVHTYKIIVKDIGTTKNLKEEIVLVRVEKKPETNKTAVVEKTTNSGTNTSEDVVDLISGHAIAAEPKPSIIKRFIGWLENIF